MEWLYFDAAGLKGNVRDLYAKKLDPDEIAASNYWERWEETVRHYSDMELTKASEKLIALSGVERNLNELSEGRLVKYAASMWESNLPAQLLRWCTCKLVTRPTIHRAPSLPWESVNGAADIGHMAMTGLQSGSIASYSPKVSVVSGRFASITAASLQVEGFLSKTAMKIKCMNCLKFSMSDNVVSNGCCGRSY
jgi:hypothetical protein